jgi:hypothetical protein
MNLPHSQIILEEAERLANQATELLPCWEELLEQAHAVSEQIQEQVQRATAETEPSP